MSEQSDPREDLTTGADHHGQDGGRDAVWAGSTQAGREQRATQDLPAMSQHPSDVSDKIDGIVAQTRADASGHPDFDVKHVLAERLSQAGIDVEAADLDALVARAGA